MLRPLRLVTGLAALILTAVLALGWRPTVNRGAPAAAPVADTRSDRLAPVAGRIRAYADRRVRGIDALVILDGRAVALAHGAADVPMNLASIRKGLLSLLIGIARDKGLIDPAATLGELDIDESATPLTATEKSATVADLLAARSGVYLPAANETRRMARTRPARGQYAPGAQFHYNNWDFNALGTIFRQQTGLAIEEAFEAWLAAPLGLQDYNPGHVVYVRRPRISDHAGFKIHLSARDLARLGALILQDGLWEGRRIVSRAWLRQSMTVHSRSGAGLSRPPYDGFGYGWWLNTETGDVIGAGWGGQYLYVDRASRLVLVARRDTGNSVLGKLWFNLAKANGRPADLLAIRRMAIAAR